MNTFNGPDVAADERDRLTSAGLLAHSILPKLLLLESTVQVSDFDANVAGHGTGVMVLTPMVNHGSFYNRQDRDTRSTQWVEALTASPSWWGATHLVKAGFDVMATGFNGTSSSSPVDVRRDDGRLARRLTFVGPISQTVATADVAAFAQDRIQVKRLLLEFGGRIDRDGILGQINVTPRAGAVLVLDDKGTAVLRGGFGLFFERTPSLAGVFDQFETAFDTRYAVDGTTLIAPPALLTHVASPNLEVARSRVWNAQYDQKLTAAWSLRAGVFAREGSHELVVEPVHSDTDGSQLLLTSTGRSSYRDGELTLRFAPGPKFEISGTYVRSAAEADLNAYTRFFDNIRWPIISTNEYAPVDSDAPHRVVAHARATIAERWFASGIFEAHSGFPFSATNEMLDWVGPRNQIFHYPTLVLLDLDLEHRFTFLKGRPWIGIRAYNALNRFTPTEVQNNLSSPTFGSFYNSYGRQLRLQVRFGG